MDTTAHGIQIHTGHLYVPGDTKLGIKALTIREHCLNDYAEFVRLWSVGASRSVDHPQGTLTSLWVLDPVFREQMTLALGALGVTDPGSLKVTHLMEMLLMATVEGSTDTRPAIFRLHEDAPDPKLLGGTDPRRRPESQKSRGPFTWSPKFFTTRS